MHTIERPTLRPVTLLVAGNILFGTGLIFHAFLYNFYLEALRQPVNVMGHAAAALTGGGVVMLLPAGMLADRAGPKLTVLCAAVVLTVGLVLGAFATTPPTVYGTAALAGIGSGMWRVAIGPILMRITDSRTRTRAFAWNVGLLVGWSGFGMALAGAVSSALEVHWGLERLAAVRLVLVLGAVSSAGSILLFHALDLAPALPAGPGAESSSGAPPSPSAARSSGNSLPLLIGLVALWMLGPALVAPFFNIFFSREHGLSIERIGLVFAAVNAVWAVAVLVSGELAERVGVRRLLMSGLLFFAPAMWALTVADSVQLAVALYFVQGAVSPVTNPLIDQWLLGSSPPERHGAVSSWRQVAADVSAMIGAGAGGQLLAERAFDALFFVAAAIGLIGSLGLIAWVHATRRPGTSISNG